MLVNGVADTKPVPGRVFPFTSPGNANKDYSTDVARQSKPLDKLRVLMKAVSLWAYQG